MCPPSVLNVSKEMKITKRTKPRALSFYVGDIGVIETAILECESH